MDVREKLVEILKGNLPHFQNDVAYWHDEHIGELADHLIAHGVTVQDNTEISDELLERLRKAPVTVMTEEPTIEVVQGWISVKDRLPEVGEAVLVFRDGGFAISEIYMIDYEGNQMWSYTGLSKDPTHWMPLPQPPKGE